MGTVGSVAKRVPLTLESALALTAASVMVAIRPPSKTTKLLGRPRSVPKDTVDDRTPAPADAVRIGHAVERVAAALPWHPLCLPTAAATVRLLRRRHIECEAHLGIVGTDPPRAHAWVTVGGVVVQGGEPGQITELASFV